MLLWKIFLIGVLFPAYLFADQPVTTVKATVDRNFNRVMEKSAAFDFELSFSSQKVAVGEGIQFVVTTGKDCFFTLVWMANNGDTIVITPPELQPLKAGEENRFPRDAKMEITPPLGRDRVYGFCTIEQPVFDLISFSNGAAGFDYRTATRQSRYISQVLQQHTVAASTLSIDIVGRDEKMYSKEDVIKVFSQPVRGITRSRLDAPIQFALDSSTLDETAKGILHSIGSAFVSNELLQARFRINGHTDSTGTPRYNDKLSEKRALAVKIYLMNAFDIKGGRLEVVGWGENMAKSDNATEWGRAENRRVEFELLD